MHKIFLKLSSILIFIQIILFLVYLILEGSLGNIIYNIHSEPLYRYSILLFAFSFALMCITVYKNKTFTPSCILFISFLAVPLIGPLSYRVHVDLYGVSSHGLISFAYPVFVWSAGRCCSGSRSRKSALPTGLRPRFRKARS